MVLSEDYDPDYVPTESEVLEYAEFLGMDPTADRDLFWIAREGLKAPLPAPWKPCRTEDGEQVYYFNFETGESVWDHPCDVYYAQVFEKEKEKRDRLKEEKQQAAQRRKQRQGSAGSAVMGARAPLAVAESAPSATSSGSASSLGTSKGKGKGKGKGKPKAKPKPNAKEAQKRLTRVGSGKGALPSTMQLPSLKAVTASSDSRHFSESVGRQKRQPSRQQQDDDDVLDLDSSDDDSDVQQLQRPQSRVAPRVDADLSADTEMLAKQVEMLEARGKHTVELPSASSRDNQSLASSMPVSHTDPELEEGASLHSRSARSVSSAEVRKRAEREAHQEHEMELLRVRKEMEDQWLHEKKALRARHEASKTEWLQLREDEMNSWRAEREEDFQAEMQHLERMHETKMNDRRRALSREFDQWEAEQREQTERRQQEQLRDLEDKVNAKRRELERTLTSISAEYRAISTQARLAQELEDTKSELLLVKKHSAAHGSSHRDSSEEVEVVRKRLDQEREAKDNAERAAREAEERVRELERLLGQRDEQHAKRVRQLEKQHDDEVAELRQRLTASQAASKRKTQLHTRSVSELESELERLRGSPRKSDGTPDQSQEVARLTRQLRQAERDMERLKLEVLKAKNAAESSELSTAKLHSEVQRAREEANTAKAKQERAQADHERDVASYQERLQQLRERVEDLQGEVERTRQEKQKLAEENKRLAEQSKHKEKAREEDEELLVSHLADDEEEESRTQRSSKKWARASRRRKRERKFASPSKSMATGHVADSMQLLAHMQEYLDEQKATIRRIQRNLEAEQNAWRDDKEAYEQCAEEGAFASAREQQLELQALRERKDRLDELTRALNADIRQTREIREFVRRKSKALAHKGGRVAWGSRSATQDMEAQMGSLRAMMDRWEGAGVAPREVLSQHRAWMRDLTEHVQSTQDRRPLSMSDFHSTAQRTQPNEFVIRLKFDA